MTVKTREFWLSLACGYRGSDSQRTIHVSWETLEKHFKRGNLLHTALPSSPAWCSVLGGPGPAGPLDQRQAVPGGYCKIGRRGKYQPKKFEKHLIIFWCQVGMQWLTTTLDQAGNEVENDSEQSNSLSERILNLFISLLIIQSPCFFLWRYLFFTHFDLPDLLVGIRELSSKEQA